MLAARISPPVGAAFGAERRFGQPSSQAARRNKGLRLEVMSKLLGHSSTVVTERAYAELLGSTIRDELLAALGDAR